MFWLLYFHTMKVNGDGGCQVKKMPKWHQKSTTEFIHMSFEVIQQLCVRNKQEFESHSQKNFTVTLKLLWWN